MGSKFKLACLPLSLQISSDCHSERSEESGFLPNYVQKIAFLFTFVPQKRASASYLCCNSINPSNSSYIASFSSFFPPPIAFAAQCRM